MDAAAHRNKPDDDAASAANMDAAAAPPPPPLTYMLTTDNVPARQAASELRRLLTATGDAAAAATVRHGKDLSSARGVTCVAPVASVDALRDLTLPERVYAVVGTWPPAALPDDDVLPQLEALVASSDGWPAALAAHRALHPTALEAASFAVKARRKGTRFKHALNDFTLGARLGAALHARFGWRVDLSAPSIEVTASLNDDGLLVAIALLRRRDSIDCKTRGGLDPHVAWAMVHSLGALPPAALVCDPMCGKGSTLLEALSAHPSCVALGLDRSPAQLAHAATNRAAVPAAVGARLGLLQADACRLPLASSSVDGLVCDLPFESHCPRFGHQLDTSGGASLAGCAREFARVLRPGRRAVFLINEARRDALHAALGAAGGPGAASGLLALCERPCPLGFTMALIVVAERRGGDGAEAAAAEAAAGGERGEETVAAPAAAAADEIAVVEAAAGGREVPIGLPWEGTGKRAEWCVLRKQGRTPMVPAGRQLS